MMNVGYLTASRDSQSDECLTPRCAVLPIIKYLKRAGFQCIWCPFDKEDSMYVRVLSENGFDVVYTHKDVEDGDFFKIEADCDCIVSNPPFSLKDKVLERLYLLGNPFMILLPQNALQSHKRTSLFIKYGLEYLGFDARIPFYTRGKKKTTVVKDDGEMYDCMEYETDEEMRACPKMSNHFASAYFCHNVLPEKLILEHLEVWGERYDTDVCE